MVLLNQENRLLTGSADSELRAWDVDYLEEVRKRHTGHICTWHASYKFKCVLNDSVGVRVATFYGKNKTYSIYSIILCELTAKQPQDINYPEPHSFK